MRSVFDRLTRFYNDPHEKFLYNIILIVVFGNIYNYLNLDHFTVMVEENKNKELSAAYFMWFSLMSQFTMGFGDLYPSSNTAKVCVALQSSLFWFINLA